MKRDAAGRFEKIKSRLVGDGSEQDRTTYQGSLESPTANIESAFIILELASRRKYKATKIDISTAYLNVEINDSNKIIMWINRELTSILVEHFPVLKPYVDEQGCLTVKILKAMYGLIQSAALWFALIYGF